MAATLTLGLAGAASANAAVTITSPAAGSYTNDSTPSFQVTGATVGGNVSLETQDGTLDTEVADGSGDVTLTPNGPLTSAPSSNITFTVTDETTDETDFVNINFNTRPFLSGNSNPVTIGDALPTIYLTGGIPDATANFYLDGQLISSPATDGNGAVTDTDDEFINLTPSNVAVGHHSAYAVSVDGDGTESDHSPSFTFDVRPVAVEFTDLADGSHLNTGEQDIAIDGIDPDADQVTIYDTDTDGNTTVAGSSSDIDADGNATVSVSLADGLHHLTVAQTVNSVESDPTSVGNNGVTVKSAAPVLAAIDTPTNNANPDFEVSNILGNNGGNSNTVNLYIDGQLAGTSGDYGDDGTYVSADDDLTDGEHTAYVTTVDDRGHEGAHSSTVTFTVDTVAPVLTFTAPTDGSTVKTATPTFTVHAEAGAQVRLWLGDGTDVTLTADADGNASYTAQDALRDGEMNYGAYATDAAGNEGAEVDGTVVIDTSTPDDGGDQGTPPTTPTTPTQPTAPTVPAAPITPTRPTTPATPATPAATATPAAPAKVSLSSHTLTASKPVTVGFTLPKAGKVKVTITKVVKGKTIVVATVTINAKSGKGSYTLKTKVGNKKLTKGNYKVSLQAVHGKKTSKKVSQAVSVK